MDINNPICIQLQTPPILFIIAITARSLGDLF